jgi:quinone-modifying oxidoreductase subunit QmoC
VNGTPLPNSINPDLYRDVAQFGARDMEICMQCATCSASCPLSSGSHTFPRKIYRYLQLGLEDKLLQSPEPWLCYYCGECNIDCPRGAEPAETMMAVRRWLTTRYDWTGLARRFYLSDAWEVGALLVVALAVILLFVVGHGPIVTDRVAVNTFVPVLWIEIGDLTMAAILTFFLMSNAFRMFRYVMAGTKVPPILYLKEARTFGLHFLTQKRWRKCGEDRSRWVKHLILVSGYLTMMTLVIVFIRWLQVDDSSWHFTSIFGYYATAVLLFITVEMFRSRLRKEEAIHRYSEMSDWLFLILLFMTTLTGIMMHAVRLAGWPMGTYVMYVIHLAIAVPMLVIEVPFGKWSHLFYRPLALFLAAVRERADQDSQVDVEDVLAAVGEIFMSCQQCGTCTSVCPGTRTTAFSPRLILRQLSLDLASEQSVDQAVWGCLTCKACEENCPRGIEIIDVMRTVRQLNVNNHRLPDTLQPPLASLEKNGNPWGGKRDQRTLWSGEGAIPEFKPTDDYCLFTCCTTAYAPGRPQAGQALPQLLKLAGTSFGSLGTRENCCGDPAFQMGAENVYRDLEQANCEVFKERGVEKLLVSSPHCLNTFTRNYSDLRDQVAIAHYTEVLAELITTGRLIPAQELGCTVTYHDPCYLGRHSGIYQPPRRVLQSIPGLKLVEMENNKERSQCCGGGGCGAWSPNPAGQSLGALRIKEALGTQAEIIATACPYCIRILDEAVKALGVTDRIVVRDIAELLLQSVEVKVAADKQSHENLKLDQEACHV